MTLPDVTPTRKQRFLAALKLAHLTVDQWRELHDGVSKTHLYEVLDGERTAGAELDAAIDATIEKYLAAGQP
jgi:hypothetical protein